MGKATIQEKRKGEKKWQKKRHEEDNKIKQQLYIIIRRGSHNQIRKNIDINELTQERNHGMSWK